MTQKSCASPLTVTGGQQVVSIRLFMQFQLLICERNGWLMSRSHSRLLSYLTSLTYQSAGGGLTSWTLTLYSLFEQSKLRSAHMTVGMVATHVCIHSSRLKWSIILNVILL